MRQYTLLQWQAAGYDANSVTDLPQNIFVNPATADLHLLNSSPAVDMGDDRGLGYDYEGDARPQGAGPDVGADENG